MKAHKPNLIATLTLITTTTLFLTLLILSTTPLSPSTSPSPESDGKFHRPRNVKGLRKGSVPATCHSKCNRCRPCVAVAVSVQSSVDGDEENEYYPQVWKCMCHNTLFSP